jgi:hypothetical protein
LLILSCVNFCCGCRVQYRHVNNPYLTVYRNCSWCICNSMVGFIDELWLVIFSDQLRRFNDSMVKLALFETLQCDRTVWLLLQINYVHYYPWDYYNTRSHGSFVKKYNHLSYHITTEGQQRSIIACKYIQLI